MEETVEATAVADPVKETAVAETLKETAMAEGKDRLCRYARTLLLFAVYLCAGVFFYTNVETKPCGATPPYTLAPDEAMGDSGSGPDVPPPGDACQSRTVPWTALDAIYFGVVTMSTVGYGDLSPTTGYSQLFTIFYLFTGILVVFSQLTATVLDLFAPAFNLSRWALTFVLPQPGKVILDGSGEHDLRLHRKNSAIFYTTRLLGPLLVWFAFQVIFAFAFDAIEPDWGFGVAFYHCLVTATTVGYGDVRIVTSSGKVCAIVHILVSVCALGAIVGDIDAARSERAAQIFRAKQLTQRFDRSRLEHLLADEKFNQDGGGIEKFEFVVGMLLEAEYVKQSDVDAYVRLFERADVTGDGKICSADIGQLTSAFDKMWPSHKEVCRALRRSGTGELRAQKCNKVAVAPSSSEARARWSRAAEQVSGGALAADPLRLASPRPLVEQQARGPAPVQGVHQFSVTPARYWARPDQAGRGGARPGSAILNARPERTNERIMGDTRHRRPSASRLILDPTAPPDQAGRRGASSSARTRWRRSGATVSVSSGFSAALEPALRSQCSFGELGGARSRVTP